MTTSNRSLRATTLRTATVWGCVHARSEATPQRDIAMWASPFTSMRARSTASLSVG